MADLADSEAPTHAAERAQSYRRRVTELLAIVEVLHEPGLRSAILMTAQDYLRMATALEKGAKLAAQQGASEPADRRIFHA